jgi:glucose uptake protein GlcU
MKDLDKKDEESLNLATTIPQWFIAGAIVVYIVGFITTSYFLDSYGIGNLVTEFWQIKYAQIGLLYLPFLMLVTIVLATLYLFRKAQKENNGQENSKMFIHGLVILLMSYMCLLIYYAAFIAIDFMDNTDVIFILIVIVLSILLLWCICKHRDSGNAFKRWYMWLLPFIVLASFVFWARNGVLFGELLRNRRVYLVCFTISMTLLIVMPILGYKIRGSFDKERKKTANVYIIIACFMVFATYMSVNFFANSIFHYIPSKMGGGNFENAPRAIFHVKDFNGISSEYSISKHFNNYHGTVAETSPLIIIEKSGDQLYVAFPDSNNGPKEWRNSDANRPNIYSIRQEQINEILHIKPIAPKKVYLNFLRKYGKR